VRERERERERKRERVRARDGTAGGCVAGKGEGKGGRAPAENDSLRGKWIPGLLRHLRTKPSAAAIPLTRLPAPLRALLT